MVIRVTPPPASVSIVIPAYNEQSTIRSCLESAIRQSSPAHEIIVVDNRSSDRTAEIVREVMEEHPDAPIRLLAQHDEQGLIPTRNVGLDAASGDILGRIDADTILSGDWVRELQAAFADPSVQAATGPVEYYDMPLRRLGLRADDRLRRFIRSLSRDYHFLFGSNMALRATAWRTVRARVCRDADDEMHEDIDLSIHLAHAGLRVAYVPTLIAGMSARRVEDSPRAYAFYVTRFERTYAAHRVMNPLLRAPMLIFFLIYPLAKTVRSLRARREVVGSG